MEFGKTLRAAREAKGLSVSELSAKTHIMSQIIAEMENENFKRIPAPIYGRGFVKQLCKTLGITEVQAMLDEFMAIFNNLQDEPAKPAKRMPAPPRPEPPAPSAPPAPPVQPPPAQPVPPTARVPSPAKPETPRREFRKPLPMPKLPHAEINWRLVILGAGVACIVLVAALTVRALYKTTNAENASPSANAAEKTIAPQSAEKTPQPRVPAKIPDLYIE